MRASIGGILNIVLILVFIVVISSLLLFNVSYSQAFRVKNKIITLYEQYEGRCGKRSRCETLIKDYEDRLGYDSGKSLVAQNNETCDNDLGYCYIMMCVDEKNNRNVECTSAGRGQKVYFKIRTDVTVRFPFIEDIVGQGVFNVNGETKSIYIQ